MNRKVQHFFGSLFKRKKIAILLIFLLALVIRLCALFLLQDTPRGDAADYDNIALNITRGKGFVSTRMGLYSYRPPLYPLFLAAVFSVFKHSYLVVGFIQAVISSLTCVLIFCLARSIFDEKSGLLSSIILAFYPTLVFYSTQLLSETIFIFILCLFTYIFFKVRDHSRKWIVSGILLGLGSLCRPVIFPFLIFLLPFVSLNLKQGFRKWGLMFCLALLTISPWTIRNYCIHHKFVLLTTYGGSNLWMGNFPGARGYMGQPENINKLIYQRGVPETEKDKLFYKKAFSFIFSNPSAFFMLSLKKLFLYWSPLIEDYIGPSYIKANNINYKAIVAVSFSCLILLAGVGIGTTSDLWRRSWLLLILAFYFMAVSMIFFVSLRFRQPIIPILSLYAGKGITFLFRFLSGRRAPSP